jgi:uncharacterized protein
MRTAFTSLVSGTLFGAGLALGGMTNPARVRGFLDIFGDWDPTLAFVMGGAVIVMAIAWRIVPRLAEPLFAGAFHLPTRSDLTPRLIGGAALFGIGWGIAGLRLSSNQQLPRYSSLRCSLAWRLSGFSKGSRHEARICKREIRCLPSA